MYILKMYGVNIIINHNNNILALLGKAKYKIE
jgi:hypothetical protein